MGRVGEVCGNWVWDDCWDHIANVTDPSFLASTASIFCRVTKNNLRTHTSFLQNMFLGNIKILNIEDLEQIDFHFVGNLELRKFGSAQIINSSITSG